MKRISHCATAMLLLFFTSCGGNPWAPTAPPSPSEDFTEIVVANNGEGTSGWNPLNGWGEYDDPLFQSKLVKIVNGGDIALDLATNYESNEDASIWTFTLRQDAFFSDGVQLTAKDVKFTLETAIKQATTLDFSMVSDIQTPDDFTLVLTLAYSDSNFIYHISSLGVVPSHLYDEMYSENPVGSGPFVLLQWDKGQQAILEPNPYYYGEASRVDRLVMLFMDQQTALAAVQSGRVDAAYANTATALSSAEDFQLLQIESVDNFGISFPTVPPQSANEDGEAVGNLVTSDIAIRKAFCYGADRDYFSDLVLDGFASPSYGIATGMDWFHEGTILENCSIEEGIRILEEGGWLDTDFDGIREKEGLIAEFDLYYPSSSETRQTIAYALAQLGAELGVNVNVIGASWDEIYLHWHESPFVCAYGNFTPNELYHATSTSSRGLVHSNPGYYSNSTVDGYMSQAMASPDPEIAQEFWKLSQWDGETGSSMLGDAPICWLVTVKHLFFVRDGLNIGSQQMQAHGDNGIQILNNVSQWYWE